MTGGQTHPALDSLHLTYNRSINCSMSGVYILIDKAKAFIEAGSTCAEKYPSYRIRMKNKFHNETDLLHKHRDNWLLFGLGSSNDELTDRFLEDIFLLLINHQKTDEKTCYSLLRTIPHANICTLQNLFLILYSKNLNSNKFNNYLKYK